MKILSKAEEIRTIYRKQESGEIKLRECAHQISEVLAKPYLEWDNGTEVDQEVLMLSSLRADRIITQVALMSQLRLLGREADENSPFMACNYCYGTIKKSEKICPHCGKRVRAYVGDAILTSLWLGIIPLAFSIFTLIMVQLRHYFFYEFIAFILLILAIVGLVIGNRSRDRAPIDKKWIVRWAILICIIAIVMTLYSCAMYVASVR